VGIRAGVYYYPRGFTCADPPMAWRTMAWRRMIPCPHANLWHPWPMPPRHAMAARHVVYTHCEPCEPLKWRPLSWRVISARPCLVVARGEAVPELSVGLRAADGSAAATAFAAVAAAAVAFSRGCFLIHLGRFAGETEGVHPPHLGRVRGG